MRWDEMWLDGRWGEMRQIKFRWKRIEVGYSWGITAWKGYDRASLDPGAPTPRDFFGSEILAKGDFLGFMKDAGIFLGREKKTEGFLWVAKKELRDFFGYAKKK